MRIIQIILNLLKSNIHVEIDVRYHNDNFYLGHDEPKYKISNDFLKHKNLWCHAKDFKTLDQIRKRLPLLLASRR